MVNEFQKATGITVAMTRKSSGETFAQVKAEAANPKGDIWWGGTGDPHLQAAEEDLTEAYESPMLAKLHDWAVKQHKTGRRQDRRHLSGRARLRLQYRSAEAEELEAPKCWADLIKPEYKGEVQIANPNSSGTAYTFLATLVQIMGEDEGLRVPEGAEREHQPVHQVGRGAGAGRGARRDADRHHLPARLSYAGRHVERADRECRRPAKAPASRSAR